MPNYSKRTSLALSKAELGRLERLSRSQTCPVRESNRARILLHYAEGRSIVEIQNLAGQSRPTIYKCIDKALAAGMEAGLKDLPHRPGAPEIGQEAREWMMSIACTQPKDLDLAAELWTITSLTRYIAQHGPEAGHPRLGRISRASVHRILNDHELKPHRVRYYLERRDPDFEEKRCGKC